MQWSNVSLQTGTVAQLQAEQPTVDEGASAEQILVRSSGIPSSRHASLLHTRPLQKRSGSAVIHPGLLSFLFTQHWPQKEMPKEFLLFSPLTLFLIHNA